MTVALIEFSTGRKMLKTLKEIIILTGTTCQTFVMGLMSFVISSLTVY